MALRTYLAATHGLALVAPMALRRRLARGKEDPARWREKLGEPSAPRPEGPLVWLHAVGLGEVQALRGLIARMAAARGDLNFLVTSTARSSGAVFAANLPPRTVHQYLPLDLPGATARFLDHWRPALSVWAEQDLWPGLVLRTAARGVPVALVNARMDAASFAARSKGRALFSPCLERMALISAQDEETAGHLAQLGARGVQVTGPMKAAAPPLPQDAALLARMQAALAGREPWLLASSHPEDEALALDCLAPGRLLVIVPRDPARAAAIHPGAQLQSVEPVPRPDAQVFIADSYGQMGTWMRLCPVTLIGGTFGPTEGHNPWEPAALGSAILHGPRTANFRNDFRLLDQAGGALLVADAQALKAALTRDFTAQRQAALRVAADAATATDGLAAAVLDLLP